MSITLRNVRKDYDAQTEVLKDISVKVETGEFFVIVGPSGCGKSTLLRMIAGLTPITAGEVSIDNTVVNDLPPKARKLTMVFQNYALFPHLDVFDNVAFGLNLQKRPKAEIKKRVLDALKLVQLPGYANREISEISGGQQQRVAIARLLLKPSDLILADEPTGSLDAETRDDILGLLTALNKEGKTIVIVTHDDTISMRCHKTINL